MDRETQRRTFEPFFTTKEIGKGTGLKRLGMTRSEMKVLCMSGYTDDSIVRHGVLEAGVAFGVEQDIEGGRARSCQTL